MRACGRLHAAAHLQELVSHEPVGGGECLSEGGEVAVVAQRQARVEHRVVRAHEGGLGLVAQRGKGQHGLRERVGLQRVYARADGVAEVVHPVGRRPAVRRDARVQARRGCRHGVDAGTAWMQARRGCLQAGAISATNDRLAL